MPKAVGNEEAKDQATPAPSRGEVKWRLECALRYSATSGENLGRSAEAVNNALAILRQGEASDVSDQKS